jgi:hypothetical protein
LREEGIDKGFWFEGEKVGSLFANADVADG